MACSLDLPCCCLPGSNPYATPGKGWMGPLIFVFNQCVMLNRRFRPSLFFLAAAITGGCATPQNVVSGHSGSLFGNKGGKMKGNLQKKLPVRWATGRTRFYPEWEGGRTDAAGLPAGNAESGSQGFFKLRQDTVPAGEVCNAQDPTVSFFFRVFLAGGVSRFFFADSSRLFLSASIRLATLRSTSSPVDSATSRPSILFSMSCRRRS